MSDSPASASPNRENIDWASELARHERWLRTVIAARCREPHAVDEIMQEVSIAVFRQAAPLRDPTKVAPWLYQIAVRQSLMYRRTHGRRRALERRFAERLRTNPTPTQQPNPLDWLVSEERRERVRVALSQLNPKDAEVLMLKYTEDWTYQQIAEHLNTTASSVESRLHRARKKLRSMVTQWEVAEV